MGRKNTPPYWLTKRLDDELLKVVRTHIPKFLALLAKDKKGHKLSNIELLKQFLTYMAKHNRAFKGIPDETICTGKWKGMSQLYDLIRKKADQLIDEKYTSPPSKDARSKGKHSPVKDQITDKRKQKEQKAEDQEAVQMEAQSHHGGLEERRSLFRQHMGSDADNESSLSNPAVTESERSKNSKSLLGKRQFRETKLQFIRLIDLYNPGELGTLTFRVQFWTNGINVTHDDFPPPEK